MYAKILHRLLHMYNILECIQVLFRIEKRKFKTPNAKPIYIQLSCHLFNHYLVCLVCSRLAPCVNKPHSINDQCLLFLLIQSLSIYHGKHCHGIGRYPRASSSLLYVLSLQFEIGIVDAGSSKSLNNKNSEGDKENSLRVIQTGHNGGGRWIAHSKIRRFRSAQVIHGGLRGSIQNVFMRSCIQLSFICQLVSKLF